MVEGQVHGHISGTSALYGFDSSSLLGFVTVQKLGHGRFGCNQHDRCRLHDYGLHHVVPAGGTLDAKEMA